MLSPLHPLQKCVLGGSSWTRSPLRTCGPTTATGFPSCFRRRNSRGTSSSRVPTPSWTTRCVRWTRSRGRSTLGPAGHGTHVTGSLNPEAGLASHGWGRVGWAEVKIKTFYLFHTPRGTPARPAQACPQEATRWRGCDRTLGQSGVEGTAGGPCAALGGATGSGWDQRGRAAVSLLTTAPSRGN